MAATQSRQRTVTLNASKAGMTRLRFKGGASPDTLYELTNGFVNASRCPQQRPGTKWKFNFADTGHTGNAGKTKGLVAFKGVLYAFTHDTAYSTSGSSSYKILVLRHPSSTTATLKAIHFAQPFMGLLYVVAEFSDSFIGHYWLQNPPAWKGGVGTPHAYMDNELVQPTTPNGYYYSAKHTFNPPTWTALLQYSVNDIVQPSVYNGYYCQVQSEVGPGTPPARSGATEPTWNLSAKTLDFSASSPPPTPTNSNPTPPNATPPGGEDGGRYSNPYRKRTERQ
jgi:hypothetical protein